MGSLYDRLHRDVDELAERLEDYALANEWREDFYPDWEASPAALASRCVVCNDLGCEHCPGVAVDHPVTAGEARDESHPATVTPGGLA
jgi:hypothetical protein